MTDYSPGALEDLKEKIVKAAIKWTMYDEPVRWDGDADSGFYGAGWEGQLPPVSGPTGTVKLKYYPPTLTAAAGAPPGAVVTGDGSNEVGQAYYEYEVDPWTSIYQPWIERIDSAFRGWDSIPEPGDFGGPISAVQDAVTLLTPIPKGAGGNDPDGSFSTTYATVDLGAGLDTMDQFLGADTAGADQGLLIFAFIDGYGPERIRLVMTNQAQVAIGLGVVLLGEQKMWDGAGTDIMAIGEAAADSFRPGGAGGGSIDLKVVKAFADLLGSFVPAPVKPVLAAGSSVLGFINEVMPEDTSKEPAVTLEGYTPDEVYQSLVDAIGKLEQRVFEQEFELAYTTLQKVIDYLHGHSADQFHLHPGDGVSSKLAEATPLTVHPEYLREIGYAVVPSIASYLGKAAEEVMAADTPGIWTRSNFIGLGSNGPYDKWSELQGLFDQVTTGSGRELVEAGRLLAVGAGFIEDADGSSREALRGVQDDLDRGSLGWDNSVPEVYTGPTWGGRPV